MTQGIRHLLIAAVTFIGGLYYFLLFVLPEKIGDFEFGIWNDQIGTGISVIGVMAIGLGLLNILRVHGTRVIKTQRGWIFSAALLGGFFVMLASEGLDFLNAEHSVNTVKRFTAMSLFSERIADEASKSEALDEPTRAGLRKKLTQLGGVLDRERALELNGEGFLVLHDESAAPARAELLAAAAKFRWVAAEAFEQVNKLSAAYETDVDPSRAEQHRQLTVKLRDLSLQARAYAELVTEASGVKRFARVLFNGFYVPLNSAMFALLGFYIAGAAYRSFRLKSVEAAVLMITAVVVILGQIPFGKMYIHDSLPSVRVWLMENLNTPGNRAMFLGSSVAAIALAMRMWLSLEKSPLDESVSK